MNRTWIFALALALISSSLAHAGYDDLKKEFEEYQPPSYYTARQRPPLDQAGKAADSNFIDVKRRITEQKAQWERSLIPKRDKTSFFHPDPNLLEKYRPALSDNDVAAKALKAGFSREALETLTMLRNPGIKAAENRFRAAIETFSQILNLDEILRQYTAFTAGVKTGVGPMKGKDTVKTKFPFPGVLSLKAQIVDQGVRASREDLETARREAVVAARKTYWDLLFVYKAQGITKETLDLLKYLEAVAMTRYETGKTSYQDVVKVRIKRKTLEEDLITLHERQQNIELKIIELLNLSPGIQLGSPKDEDPSREMPSLNPLYDIALEKRQELRHTQAVLAKMESMIELAETLILPPYTLNLSLYEDEAVNQAGSLATKQAFPITTKSSKGAGLPKMPWYGTNDAYLRQTRQRLLALREDLKQAEARTLTMVRKAWFELDRAKREMSLYQKTVINLSQSALDVSTRGYESGNVTFADVIDSYTIWLEARLAFERKRSDLGIARAELERILGTSFSDRAAALLPKIKD
jgi:cobalt-zinc-cadmium efflux system outer membrane protein